MSRTTELIVNDLVAAWNGHDIEAVASLFAPDFDGVDVGQPSRQTGPAGVRASMEQYLAAFPDMVFTDLELVAHESRVAVYWVARGTHRGKLLNIPPTGKTVVVQGATFLTVESGKITKGMSLWDVAGMLREIGLLPEL